MRLTQTESLESSCNWSDDNLITNKCEIPRQDVNITIITIVIIIRFCIVLFSAHGQTQWLVMHVILNE